MNGPFSMEIWSLFVWRPAGARCFCSWHWAACIAYLNPWGRKEPIQCRSPHVTNATLGIGWMGLGKCWTSLRHSSGLGESNWDHPPEFSRSIGTQPSWLFSKNVRYNSVEFAQHPVVHFLPEKPAHAKINWTKLCELEAVWKQIPSGKLT